MEWRGSVSLSLSDLTAGTSSSLYQCLYHSPLRDWIWEAHFMSRALYNSRLWGTVTQKLSFCSPEKWKSVEQMKIRFVSAYHKVYWENECCRIDITLDLIQHKYFSSRATHYLVFHNYLLLHEHCCMECCRNRGMLSKRERGKTDVGA